MHSLVRTSLVVCLLTSVGTADEWYTRATDWHGHSQFHFRVAERPAWLVVPQKPIPGNPWIWRARFPGYHDEMDVELVSRGFHLAYVDVAGLFGSPAAIDIGDKFYATMTGERGLSMRPALEGVSRGGLFVYNWAVRNPQSVSCIYCDTPVLDFRSWPGGKRSGKGSVGDWKRCLTAYGISESQSLDWNDCPVDAAAKVVAGQKIPVLHIVSENDVIVPPAENTRIFEQRLKQVGHSMTVISVPFGTEKSSGHHFTHPAPERVVAFIQQHAGPSLGDESQ